ncbi:MAG: hypothetical protein KIS78_23675 [Labilithrix sp.]|nr:hypothetical protein [Labilithrix sp.]
MTRFVEQAIARAGLAPVLPARARGDLDAVRALVASLGEIDLLALGAVADLVRASEAGDVVHVHPAASSGVQWIRDAASELELLRAVAVARVTGPIGARVGVDWGEQGLELAQVALGFGATDLTGPITRKSGDLIADDELKKVKGQGMVAASALKRREIAALVRNAGRSCEFTPDRPPPGLRGPAWSPPGEIGGGRSGPPAAFAVDAAEAGAPAEPTVDAEEVAHA